MLFWWTTFFLHRPSLPGDWHYVWWVCVCVWVLFYFIWNSIVNGNAPVHHSLLLLLHEITFIHCCCIYIYVNKWKWNLRIWRIILSSYGWRTHSVFFFWNTVAYCVMRWRQKRQWHKVDIRRFQYNISNSVYLFIYRNFFMLTTLLSVYIAKSIQWHQFIWASHHELNPFFSW